jgi:hypothetical protein
MKKTLTFLLLICAFNLTMAQETSDSKYGRPDFIISGNISSGAALLSLDFEKLIYLKSNRILAAGLGLGFNQEFNIFSNGESPTNYFMLPHHITWNFGKKRSFFELGVGASWVSGDKQNWYLVYPMLGYRFHPFKNPGFSFKVWAYYLFGQTFVTVYAETLFSPVGLSIGLAL